jgi:hypothetical protein
MDDKQNLSEPNPTPTNSPNQPQQVSPLTTQTPQYPMSASQMGLSQPKDKFLDFNVKKLVIKGVMALVLIGIIFTGLVFANIFAGSEFNSISYDNANGENYNLKFYSKHSSKNTKSGTKQLVSKVSKDGKFPVNLSIAGGKNGLSGYDRLKDCASFSKVFDVQNNNLNQKISVCNAIDGNVSGQSSKGTVYIAGFTHNDKVHIVTISQDYADIDKSSQSGAKE